jgi:hypothetical protein
MAPSSTYEPSEYSRELQIISKQNTPRVIDLLMIMPSRFISAMFRQLYPDATKREPEVTRELYWDSVYKFIGAIPDSINIDDQPDIANWYSQFLEMPPSEFNLAARE